MASGEEEIGHRRSDQLRRRIAVYFAAAFLGIVFGSSVLFTIGAWSRRNHLPYFGQRQFEAARRRWAATGPDSYDIEVQVSGRQPAVYRVEVRQGEPRRAFRNGQPLRQRRTFGTWSVPGMFSTIASDVANVEDVAAGDATQQTPQLDLRGVFHPVHGYPVRYLRLEKVRFGNNRSVYWEVLSFVAITE